VSPYEHAAVLVVDGVGEVHSTTLWEGRGSTSCACSRASTSPTRSACCTQGLTAWLGFAVNEGEYKVMGLAAWGKPRFREEFARIIQLHPDGATRWTSGASRT
jgi:carbamoyltransferase